MKRKISYRLFHFCALFLIALTLSLSVGVFAADVPPAPDPDDPSSLCSSFTGSGQPTPGYCEEYTDRQGSGDAVTDPNAPLTGRGSLLYRIIQLVTVATGAISVTMIIVGGFKYVVSGGDSNATKGAKDTILYAVIGLVIALFAQVIITFVLSSL